MGVYEEVVAIRKRVEDLERIEQPARSGGLPVYPSLTAGSVLFAGTGGVLAQDNSNFFWDDTNNRLGIGKTNPATALDVTGAITAGSSVVSNGGRISHITGGQSAQVDVFTASNVGYIGTGTNHNLILRTNDSDRGAITNGGNFGIGTTSPTAKLDVTAGYIRAKDDGSNTAPTSGKGVELVGTSSVGHVQCYNRDSSAWQDLNVSGAELYLNTGGSTALKLDSSQRMIKADGAFHMSGTGSTTATGIELGGVATGNRYCVIDMHGDDTYTDFGLRIIRNNGGANTDSDLQHRGTGALKLVAIDAGAINFQTSNTSRWTINSSGDLLPAGTGSLNIGNATVYMNDVSYKTLTDRGCLAFIAKWEMPDGSKLSNLEVIRNLRPHETDKTIYGETKLDYSWVPKHSRKEAPIAEDDTEVDAYGPDGKKLKFKKGEKMGSDGVEMTSMFSAMLGAIRELADKVEKLEAQLSKQK